MNIRLHIDRVVLDGIAVERPQLLRAALERELSNSLRRGGLSPQLRSGIALPSIRGGAIELERNPTPAKLGSRIARAVYHGIGATK